MAFTRRSFLAGFVSCPLCAAARAEGAHWSYDDVQNWGSHDSASQACAIGGEQSPVNLTGAIKADIHAPALSWKPQAFKLATTATRSRPMSRREASRPRKQACSSSNNFISHAQRTCDRRRARGDGGAFRPCRRSRRLLVLGALMQAGGGNEAFAALMAAAPPTESEVELKKPIDAEALLPKARHFLRYEGSLTTPPARKW